MRSVLLSILAGVALLASGCGATPGPAQKTRADFIVQTKRLRDDELAKLCPSLFPTDFLKDPKRYSYKVTKKPAKPTAQETAAAQRAGCSAQGTPPKPK